MENWKEIKGYKGIYEVSDLGNVRSLNYNHTKQVKNLSQCNDKDGYKLVGITKNKKTKTKNVHRLVANAFIQNHENKPCVNHINGIKSDNRIENLEWVSYSENTLHSYNVLNRCKPIGGKNRLNELNKNSKIVLQVSSDGFLIGVFPSLSEVCRQNKGYNVNMLCQKIIKKEKYKSYIWLK